MSRSTKGRFDPGWSALLTAVFVLSLGSTVSKKSGVPGLTMACIRSFLACAAWQIILAFRRRHLTLRNLRALSYDEIADELRINVGTVKSRIVRAERALRRWYFAQGRVCARHPHATLAACALLRQ